jgi:hypothetical protein
MRRLFPGLLAVLLGALALLVAPAAGSASAAVCKPDVRTVPEAVDAADAVVTVKVVRKDGRTSAKPAQLSYKARVVSSFKGKATGRITLLTETDGAIHNGCDVKRLAVGTTYLLFLTTHGDSWYASSDMPSSADVAVLQPQVEAALAPPTVTFGEPQTGAPKSLRRVAAPGVALVIIGLLGLLVVRRSPRSHA